ncbi:MAG TPA: prohibitin family protein [Xanthobacteraceae bacterium]|nr:prohibitin family protein [Xanthobacteraceae bacterium]
MARYPQSIDDLPPRRRRRGLWRLIARHIPGVSVVLLTALLVVVVLWPYVVITVQSGRVGVLWKRFNGIDLYCLCWVGRGTVLDPREIRDEGLHIIWPWDKLYLYDLRLQSSTQTYNAISKDGVSVTAQISVRYQLLHNSVAVLHKFIGPDYLTSVVSPELGSQARQVISQYTAEEVYTSREIIQKQIRDNAQKSLAANLNKLVQPEAMEQPDPRHYNDFLQNSVQILDTLVLSIELPPDIVAAINRQTEQYYMIQEYKFRVQREAEETKRKQIEADGIAAFQKTVSQGISESYLRWRGIEATLQLALSANTKIVVIGSGKDGLPIILGNVETPVSSGAGGPSPAPPASAAPTGRAPPLTPPGAPPPAGGSTGIKPTGEATPPSPEKTASGAPAAANEAQPASSSPLTLPEVQAILSRISGALNPLASGTSSNTEAKPKP